MSAARKHFFFEKKKQKILSIGFGNSNWHLVQVEKVFWFFFSKKNILSWLAFQMLVSRNRYTRQRAGCARL